MDTRLILRVLDAAGALLAWGEVVAHARGDGALWAPGVVLGVERAGVPAVLSVHWPDVNVEVREPLSLPAVSVGTVLPLVWPDRPILTVGPMATGLPPVTVRGAAVAIPVGALGARS